MPNDGWLLTEVSRIDRRSCVLTLARCLDTAVCYASLRRVKSDCVWNDRVKSDCVWNDRVKSDCVWNDRVKSDCVWTDCVWNDTARRDTLPCASDIAGRRRACLTAIDSFLDAVDRPLTEELLYCRCDGMAVGGEGSETVVARVCLGVMGALRPACSVRDSRGEGVLGDDWSPETSLLCQRQSWRGRAWGWWEPWDQLVLWETVVTRVYLGVMGALRPACSVRDSRDEGVLGGDGSPETSLLCSRTSATQLRRSASTMSCWHQL